MLEKILVTTIDTSLVLFAGLVVVLLYAANEIGQRIGLWRARSRPAHERDLTGIGTITAGMLGLLAFTLSLTINIAQNRFELRRGLPERRKSGRNGLKQPNGRNATPGESRPLPFWPERAGPVRPAWRTAPQRASANGPPRSWR